MAPIRVIRPVWETGSGPLDPHEAPDLSMLTGTRDQRTVASCGRPTYLINFEEFAAGSRNSGDLLHGQGRRCRSTGSWDEISKCKNSSTQRVKAVKKILPHFGLDHGDSREPLHPTATRICTGSIRGRRGQRLGTSKAPHSGVGSTRRRGTPTGGARRRRGERDQAVDRGHHAGDVSRGLQQAPDLVVNDINIEMPENLRALYDRMEKEFFIQLDSGKQVEMFNQAALTNKCLQFANGAMYPVAGMPLWEPIHDPQAGEALERSSDEARVSRYRAPMGIGRTPRGS